jgi:hypothetical protein
MEEWKGGEGGKEGGGRGEMGGMGGGGGWEEGLGEACLFFGYFAKSSEIACSRGRE